MEILDLHRSGLSQRAIARRLGISRNTVKKYFTAPEDCLKNPKPYHRASILEPYYDAIKAWIEEDGYYTATWIYDLLVNQGYTGSYDSMIQFLQIDSPPVAGYPFHIKNKPDILKMEMACIVSLR